MEKLPWEEVQKHSNPSKCFQYTFYFGVFPLNEVTEFVQEYFHSQEETPICLPPRYAMLRSRWMNRGFISKTRLVFLRCHGP